MHCHLGSHVFGLCKRLMNFVIREKDGCYSKNYIYGDTNSAYIDKKHWSTLIDNGFVGKSPGLKKMIAAFQAFFMLGSWLPKKLLLGY